MRTRISALTIILALVAGCKPRENEAGLKATDEAPPAVAAPDVCADDVALATLVGIDWGTHRKACQERLAKHLAKHQDGWKAFASTALGRGGLPLILLKVLPDIDPDVWGKPGDDFASFGFFYDSRAAKRGPLPTGMTWSKAIAKEDAGLFTPNIDLVTLSCGACHIGRVRVSTADAPAAYQYIDGGVNTQLDINRFRVALGKTMAKYDSDAKVDELIAKVQKLVKSKPKGFFYGDAEPSALYEEEQRLLYTAPVVSKKFLRKLFDRMRLKIAFERAVSAKRIATSYGADPAVGAYISEGNAPGSVDAIGNTIYRVAGQEHFGKYEKLSDIAIKVASWKEKSIEALPTQPTPADFMSIWGQNRRYLAQWNGDLRNGYWRNIAAQLGVIGDAENVDLTITGPAAAMMYGLTPTPYPFDVDMDRARKGETHFKANCAGCHKPQNHRVYSETGVDLNKARMINPSAAVGVLKSLQAVCKDPNFTITGPEGQPEKPCALPPEEIVIGRFTPETQGYAGNPLDGIWARAPYLHNGSVPTLRHMLVPGERPDTFVRGAVDYDTTNVGWIWEKDRLEESQKKDPTARIYDTRLPGFGHFGHDKDLTMDGVTYVLDWSAPQYAEDVKDLLEYLKTL